MKSITNLATTITMRMAALTTIAVLASTLSLTPSAHAASLLDKVQQLLGKKQTTSQTVAPAVNNDTAKLKQIIASGDAEINRRLQALTRLNTEITAAVHLNTSDKTTLQSEVNSSISSLAALKTKLDADTSLSVAKTDAASIATEYRVYALVVPKVHLIKLADDIQATDTKLSDTASKLQTRLAKEKASGKDTSALETKLTDMTAQIAAAQNIAGNVETKIVGLQPSDYNSDHKILSGYGSQLRTARSNDQSAYTEAKAIISTLKTL
jgi:hypothetical protein